MRNVSERYRLQNDATSPILWLIECAFTAVSSIGIQRRFIEALSQD